MLISYALAAGGHTASITATSIHNSFYYKFVIASVGHDGMHKLHETQLLMTAFLTCDHLASQHLLYKWFEGYFYF